MRKLTLAWSIALFLLAAACRNDKPPSLKETLQEAAKEAAKIPGINAGTGTFDIKTPDGWQRKVKKISGLTLTILLAPQTAGVPFQASVTIITQALDNASFDKYFNGVLSGAGRTIVDQGEKDINGHSAKWVRFSSVTNGRNVDGIMYVIPGGNGIVYVITCGAPKGTMPTYQTGFDEAVNSFQVHEMIKVNK
jgi:hypothetical protein